MPRFLPFLEHFSSSCVALVGGPTEALMSLCSSPFVTARRQVLFGGAALVATSLIPASSAFAQRGFAGVVVQGGGTRPTYLPQPGSSDPVAHSLAENLFWNEQLM